MPTQVRGEDVTVFSQFAEHPEIQLPAPGPAVQHHKWMPRSGAFSVIEQDFPSIECRFAEYVGFHPILYLLVLTRT